MRQIFAPEDNLKEGGVGIRGTIFSSFCLELTLVIKQRLIHSSSMDQQHSTLELVKFDETARAPERDHDVLAAELDASVLAPQVRKYKIRTFLQEIALTKENKAVPATTPQVVYDSSFPEVHINENEKSIRDYAHSYPKIKPRFKWPWIVVALVIAAAIAIGVGVGIRRHHRDHKQSATIMYGRCIYHTSCLTAR